MYVGLHLKYPLFLSDFIGTVIFPKDFRKILNIEFLKTELHAGGQRDGKAGKKNEATGRSSQFCEPTYKSKF
jgi:hypothetical protein